MTKIMTKIKTNKYNDSSTLVYEFSESEFSEMIKHVTDNTSVNDTDLNHNEIAIKFLQLVRETAISNHSHFIE